MKVKSYIIIVISIMLFSTSSCERKSGRLDSQRNINKVPLTDYSQPKTYNNKRTTIKMSEENGVYLIPCKINGIQLEFIFDTGASDITMSLTEALVLYKNGTLTDEDFIGLQQYQIANGEIEEGTSVRLKKVEIGNQILYNVQATIIHNMKAPLLLGQSALRKFGKISIDYNNKEITFE